MALRRMRLRARMAGVPERPANRSRSSTSDSDSWSWMVRSAMPWRAAVLTIETWIVQPGFKDLSNAAALDDSQVEARNGKREVPADFLFCCFAEKTDELTFPALRFLRAIA